MSATASDTQLVLSCSESDGKSHQLLRPYLSQLYAYQMGGDTDTHKQGAQAAGVFTPRGCASSQLICPPAYKSGTAAHDSGRILLRLVCNTETGLHL